MIESVLTDKVTVGDKTFAFINGVRYDVPGYVLPYLSEIKEGDRIEYNENNQILTRIWRQSPRTLQAEARPAGKCQKNEKLIVYQHNFGIVADSYFSCYPLDDDVDFDAVMRRIYDKTKEISDEMVRDCGGDL